jgi:hypothetical protein
MRLRHAALAACLTAAAVLAPAAASAAAAASRDTISEYCFGCKPPLKYSGGPVLDTRGPQGLTVTPIYWAPPGTANQFPAGYEALIDGYSADVAAASGDTTNVYSIGTEYYDIVGGQSRNIRYHITAGTPVVDTDPLPPDGCQADEGGPGYTACIQRSQVLAELKKVVAARHLPRGRAYFYPVFFPPRVQTGDGQESKSGSQYCAYHDFTGSGATQIVLGNEPYPDNGCTSGQSPNGNPAADTAIDNLSHELNEATTDPMFGYKPSWRDGKAYEVGDLCSYYYGTPLGSTEPADAQSTEYNQAIAGGRYYTQNEFSNYAYHRFGMGVGCQPSESVARGRAPGGSLVAHMHLDASPHTLPAHARATSSVFLQEWDRKGFDIPGDRISFTSYVLSGKGHCGTVRPAVATTDGAGSVSVTYRASRSNIACGIVANDALAGKSDSGVVYQGTKRSIAPQAGAAFPRKVTAGRRSTFTTSFTNPMRSRIADARVAFEIYSIDEHSPNVRARQVHLSVSRHGRRGPFAPVRLSGSTGQAGISGVIGGAAGFDLRGRRKLTLTYRIRLGRGVPRRRRRPILQLQAFLDQVNPASGGDTGLAETRAGNVKVR